MNNQNSMNNSQNMMMNNQNNIVTNQNMLLNNTNNIVGNQNMMINNPNMMMNNQNMNMNNQNMMMNNQNMNMNNPNAMVGNQNMMMNNSNMMMNNPNMMMGNPNFFNNQDVNKGDASGMNDNKNSSIKENNNEPEDILRNVKITPEIWNIVFELNTGPIVNVRSKEDSTFKEIVKMFFQKINLEEKYAEDRIRFIYSGAIIDSNSNSTLKELKINNKSTIDVYDDKNVTGT
jgi:hypothetical protein